MPDLRNVYWDANLFLYFVNEEAGRMPVLQALLSSSASGDIAIYTSALSKVEVAFGAEEQRRSRLDSEVSGRINSLWADPAAISVVEYHDAIGNEATRLIRDGITRGWSLRSLDAIHLATAQWLSDTGIKIDEFHTYDKALFKYAGVVDFDILEPYIAQPRLPV